MVAKSYQNNKILCEPFEENGRMYVKIATKTGGEKQVRWYTNAEYAKMYGVTITKANSKYIGVDGADHSNDPYFKTQKELLGFKNGFIYIFKGDTYANKEWFKEHKCHFTRLWGWGWSSEIELADELPEGIEAVKLMWDSVGSDEDERLFNDEKVIAAVESVIYDPSDSEFVGLIGDRITVEVTIIKNIALDGYYGASHMHIMEDADGNEYVWNTAAKDLEEGSVQVLTGTIKDHKVYRNTKQTILTRCKVA